ncbi:MAG: hypothetical protein WD490_03815 [Opitutales bacterium]
MSSDSAELNEIPAEGGHLTDLHEYEREVIEFFVRLVQVVGFPRSIGEVYGLLYISELPLCRDEIMQRLKISLGSASQALKQLRALRAVKTSYRPGVRRDYFIPETEFKELIAGFMHEEVHPHLNGVRARLERIDNLMAAVPEESRSVIARDRIEKLERFHQLSRRFLRIFAFVMRT